MAPTQSDIAELRSAILPDDADQALWDSLSDEQKRKVLIESEEAGFKSGISDGFSMERVKAAALASLKHEV